MGNSAADIATDASYVSDKVSSFEPITYWAKNQLLPYCNNGMIVQLNAVLWF